MKYIDELKYIEGYEKIIRKHGVDPDEDDGVSIDVNYAYPDEINIEDIPF